MSGELLTPDEPGPAIVRPGKDECPFLLVADHAGRAVPHALGDMGLAAAEWERHIAWDIGIAELAEALAARLGAPLVRQRYSRLVIDCNRDPARADAVPEVSDGTLIPANQALDPAARASRVAAIHAPYHAAIAERLAVRDAASQRTTVVALHSFTPEMNGIARPWHAGVLHGGGDERFSEAILGELRAALDVPVGDNQPYAMIGTDYTVPHHCFHAGRDYAELEIRQDLLAAPGGAEEWADRLAGVLTKAWELGKGNRSSIGGD
jgi:predicted N-formylglutamate amidohydrolase